ncbi:MAG: Sigma 54 modulation protein/ribosomal protein S30EA [candidate division CPR2 bacterium GW2011_GWC1_39_9]|uniref:Sigma 54 modulation protein/ribosomal protein S30EA n=1 Tax=candidate division CPR2 bacterium GW2011_GWC2_39_10 TaxID=1618345 RepID=A0A0G0M4J9_UNCC2|nr:MAG: Sigma 54 modulation protein/ribosomal protein S30EA [candidate division CPR2 bacterium GW2011_GWC2_39_10]KKR34935.1 MAG: Sigma 54 modulation protein/ribosomal protein S30EA [candidate division CPR2 bacterium GW2011_GWC1_39_9]
MNISITGKDFELTDSLENFVKEKANKLSKYDARINRVQVILSVDDGHHRKGSINTAEIIIDRPGKDIIIKESRDEMHSAIDIAMERAKINLERQKKDKISGGKYREIIKGILTRRK